MDLDHDEEPITLSDMVNQNKNLEASELLIEIAKDTSVEDVVVITADKEGNLRVLTTPMPIQTAYFLAGLAQQYIIDG